MNIVKILVIGGTRFIGLYVVRSLLEKGHQVALFNRSGPSVFAEQVQWHQGDRNDEGCLRNALKNFKPDAVLDMIPFLENHARILVKAAEGQTPRIVTISSMDVYRAYGLLLGIEPPETEVEPDPIAETSPLRSRLYPYRGPELRPPDDPSRIMDDYDKIPIENIVMNDDRIAGTVLRLPIVFGPYDGQHRLFEHLKRMLDNRPAIIIEKPYARWRNSRGYVANVAEGIALACVREEAAGTIFNVADEKVWSTEDWVRQIAASTGWSGSVILTEPSKTPDHLRSQMNTNQHLVANTSRIRSVLGYSEPVDLTEALLRTIEWETANPPEMTPEREAALFDYAAEDATISACLHS